MPLSYDDQVGRLEKFRADHPEITIVPPSKGTSPFWVAMRSGERLADAYWLEQLLDELEQMFP
jgi:hypothetical protein